jgi:hypothetical protein
MESQRARADRNLIWAVGLILGGIVLAAVVQLVVWGPEPGWMQPVVASGEEIDSLVVALVGFLAAVGFGLGGRRR